MNGAAAALGARVERRIREFLNLLESLAALLALIGAQGANVDNVAHQRRDPTLNMGEVEIEMSVETRGPDHSETVIASLRSAGYDVTFL